MKKVLIIFFSICLMITFLPGCNNKSTTPQNTISPMSLTADQIEIASLLNNYPQNVLFFEYKTEEEYNSAEFWVEVYKDGVLLETPAKISYYNNEGYKLNGILAVTITTSNNTNYQWAITARENGATYSNIGESSIIVDDILASGSTQTNDAVEIENGKEIVLYTSMFSDGEIRSYSEQQRYVEEPELLKEYPYTHIIKCKFNKFIT